MHIPKKIVNKMMKIQSLQKDVERWFEENEPDTHILWDDIEITNKPREYQGSNSGLCNIVMNGRALTTEAIYIKYPKINI